MGPFVGAGIGEEVGPVEGDEEGCCGLMLGLAWGLFEGLIVGLLAGDIVGFACGDAEGLELGDVEGTSGLSVGEAGVNGCFVGAGIGEAVGDVVGPA